MWKCTECGKDVSNNDFTCPKCKTPMADDSNQDPSELVVEGVEDQSDLVIEEKGNKPPVLIKLLNALGVLMIIGAICLGFATSIEPDDSFNFFRFINASWLGFISSMVFFVASTIIDLLFKILEELRAK